MSERGKNGPLPRQQHNLRPLATRRPDSTLRRRLGPEACGRPCHRDRVRQIPSSQGRCRMVHHGSVRSRCRPARLIVTLISTVAACTDSTAPTNHPELEPAASVRWNAIARDLVIKYRTDPPLASRTYALLSVAQDRAVRAVAGTAGMPKP